MKQITSGQRTTTKVKETYYNCKKENYECKRNILSYSYQINVIEFISDKHRKKENKYK